MTYSPHTPCPPGYEYAITMSVGDTLYCHSPHSEPLEGIIRFLDDTRAILEVEDTWFYSIDRRTQTDRDGDRWVRRAGPKVEWLNIYDDGSVSSEPHASWEEAVEYSKYNKTRIGIIERAVRGSTVLSAKVHRTAPQLRSVERPQGYNPYE